MIWTVTLNPALDITHEVPVLRHGESHRVEVVRERPGGKGINVGLVALQLGEKVGFAGFLGGSTGHQIETLLNQAAPTARTSWTRVPEETRRSFAILDGAATLFNEAGSSPAPQFWEALTRTLTQEVHAGDVVAVSGSMPGDAPSAAMVSVLDAIRSTGALVVLDTSGKYLVEGAAHADVVKPNTEELLAATGRTDIASGVTDLLAAGTQCVIVSRGADGIDAHTADGHWHAQAGARISGNPTGAGDAAVASLAQCIHHSLAEGNDPFAQAQVPGLLLQAAATSAAAVARPVAGEIDMDLRASLLHSATVERIDHAL